MSGFSSRLLEWYRQNRRELPWRGHPDPYAVWVSEIMLQQTRVETVIPYFESWIKRFPTIKDLAEASEQEVLKSWEGLGYYSRARNFHNAARLVQEQFSGVLPRDREQLLSLPGIGLYTAGAIASIAFGMDEATLDGNIRRVFSRIFDVQAPLGSTAAESQFWTLARKVLPHGHAGDFNQALMELGATVCLPKKPHCDRCPVSRQCKALRMGIISERPVVKRKPRIPHYLEAAAVIRRAGRVLLARRPARGLLGGLWEFPRARVSGDPAREAAQALRLAYQLRVRKERELGTLQHAYTHFRVTVHIFECKFISLQMKPALKWIRISDLEDYPMGRIDRQIARKLSR